MRGLAGRAGKVRAARRAAALAICGAVLLAAPGARAEDGGILGFLSSAFGVGNREQAPAAAPAPSEGEQVRPLTVRRAPRKAAHAGEGRARLAHAPGKVGPVSIYEDPTLRNGDAVMTKDGMKVFAGGRFSPDRPYGDADFVTVSTARTVTPEMKKTVIELNKLPHG